MKIKNKLLGIIPIICILIFVNNICLKKFTESNENKYLILVNKDHPLPFNYEPKDLVKPNIRFLNSTKDESRYMDKEVAKALECLFKEAQNDNITLIGSSAYRSYKDQVKIFKDSIKDKGLNYTKNYVAKPGKSEHQSGIAIDITNESRSMSKTSKEAQWLSSNAYRFGFILRYPEGKESITGYNYEPWHVRYVGKDVAKYIYDNNITLEEYLNK